MKKENSNSKLIYILIIVVAIVLVAVIAVFAKKDNLSENALASVVKVGDYIKYDAGVWGAEDLDETHLSTVPSKQGEFGGIISGASKNESTSVPCYLDYQSNYNGWRVLSVDGATVTLVHAGTPACYYHEVAKGGNDYQTESINNLNNLISQEFLNSEYAESARSAVCADFFESGVCRYSSEGDAEDNTMFAIGGYYWLATPRVETSLWFWSSDEEIFRGCGNHTLGIRPVIVLKDNVIWNGNGDGASAETAYEISLEK